MERVLLHSFALASAATLFSSGCASGASMRNSVANTFPESCVVQCHRENPNSLYDENRCNDDCRVHE